MVIQPEPGQEVPPIPGESQPQEETPTEQLEYPPELPQQFNAMLQKQYGITMEQFKAGIEFIESHQADFQLLPVASAWNVDLVEAGRRVDQVLAHIKTLPEAEQQRLNSEGNLSDVVKIYDQLAKTKKATGLLDRSSTGGTSTQPAQEYLYTESQINAMDEQTRMLHDQRILWAYTNNKVKLGS